ncbi:hypothetical protein GCM10023142_16150 [Anaerocolumna aminovalerica]
MFFDDSPYKESYPIQGYCVMTGEFDGIQSSITRMITLNIDKNKLIMTSKLLSE